jgi:hypothetical protein
MLARTLNMLLGQWLVLSAFLWRHDHPQLTDTVVVGVLASAIAFLAVTYPSARRWNLLLSAWLLVATLSMPHQAVTAWNNVLVAVAMFALAIVPGPERRRAVTLDERLRAVATAARSAELHGAGR